MAEKCDWTVLVIEDNPADARLVEEMLKSGDARFRLLHAQECRQALALLEREQPQVILLDLGLPDGQALDTLSQIHYAAPDVPIVVLSINADENLALKALTAGAQDFLVKWQVNGPLLVRALRYAVERKQLQERLYYLAHHDALTGLPNRSHFYEQVHRCLASARRHGRKAAFLFVDVDDFKPINDRLGHHVGDEVLKAVGWRLNQCVRATDKVARVGGDEFALLVTDLDEVATVGRIADKLVRAFDEPLVVDGHALKIRISMGVAVFPTDALDVETLVRKADEALYRAKNQRGESSYRFYSDALEQGNTARRTLERELSQALARGEFVVYYQPQLDVGRGRLHGMEALLRWRHPQRGLLVAGEFLSGLEESGLIVVVGEWVLGEACRQAVVWLKAELGPIRVAVNVSATELLAPAFVDRVVGILEATGLDPPCLELEFSETLIRRVAPRVQGVFERLHALGVRLVIDEIGRGDIALKQLLNLPIHGIKIDRAVIGTASADRRRLAVLRGLIQVAQVLDWWGQACGVETAEQMALLRGECCDEVQGYLVSVPLSPEDCTELLRLPRAEEGP